MEQNYDFSKIGKQMPYTVPDGFFDQLEENVMNEVKKVLPQDNDTITDDFENVELAFNNLSTEDQDYLLEVYQEELFLENDLNDLNNEESI